MVDLLKKIYFSRVGQPSNIQTQSERFQNLSLQAYGRPVTLHPQQLRPVALGRGVRGVRGADTDEGGRRAGPNDSTEGFEDGSLPAYDGTLERPPKYKFAAQDTFRTGGSGSGSVEISMRALNSNMLDSHLVDSRSSIGEEEEEDTPDSSNVYHRVENIPHLGNRGGSEEVPPEYNETPL